MLAESLQSIKTTLEGALPDAFTVSFSSPDSLTTSWVEIEADVPTPVDDLAEMNRVYTSGIDVTLRGIINAESNLSGGYIHFVGAIETARRALRNLIPSRAENFVQDGGSQIEAEGQESSKRWYRATLSYTLTFIDGD